nr:beta-lactamase family protein [Ruminococcus sp.]
YGIASVSKVYVTAAVMQLADEGKVDIDKPVTEYIPDFTLADERYKDITVRMLMNHTSGLEGTFLKNEGLYSDIDHNYSEALLESLSHRRLKAAPGEFAAYCNDGFSLLHIIVENVSGMSFTDYLRKNISDKIGAEHTGTPFDMFGDSGLARVYRFGNVPQDNEYCMGLGSGGMLAAASDVAEFGSTFFKGNELLISESAKNGMALRWDGGSDEYMDDNGLGWDYVEKLHYEQSGIKVLGKGGDSGSTHSFLMVAPDENVSISVLSAGGSSALNEIMSEALLDVVLAERGKTVDKTVAEIEPADSVSEKYRIYEGYYSMLSTAEGNGIVRIYFDENTMYTENIGTGNTTVTTYKPTTDGGFVKVDENGNITAEREVIYFEERGGKVYTKMRSINVLPGLGESESRIYNGERMADNNVSDTALSEWNEIADKPFVLYGDKYSSSEYDSPFLKLSVPAQPDGYVIGSISYGSDGVQVGRTFRIKDEKRIEFFQSIPSSSSRDIFDVSISNETLSDGTSIQSFNASNGWKYRIADELPELTADVSEVKLYSDEAQWYRIGENMGGGSITAERPEHSVICVYNKFRELVYTTHVNDPSAEIPLPHGGYILFHGETGGCVKVFG